MAFWVSLKGGTSGRRLYLFFFLFFFFFGVIVGNVSCREGLLFKSNPTVFVFAIADKSNVDCCAQQT